VRLLFAVPSTAWEEPDLLFPMGTTNFLGGFWNPFEAVPGRYTFPIPPSLLPCIILIFPVV
jgi:hypothetical protein